MLIFYCLILCACSLAPKDNRSTALPKTKGEFITGEIVYGPERTVFIPCGNDEIYWLNNARDSYTKNPNAAIGWEEVEKELDSQPLCSLKTMPCKSQTAYVLGYALVNRDESKREQEYWIKRGFGQDGYPAEIRFTSIKLTSTVSCPNP